MGKNWQTNVCDDVIEPREKIENFRWLHEQNKAQKYANKI